MWAVTVAPAAQTLGILPNRLADWIRKDKFKFEGVQYPYWDPSIPKGLQGQRLYPREWLVAMAAHMGREPDFGHIEHERDRSEEGGGK